MRGSRFAAPRIAGGLIAFALLACSLGAAISPRQETTQNVESPSEPVLPLEPLAAEPTATATQATRV